MRFRTIDEWISVDVWMACEMGLKHRIEFNWIIFPILGLGLDSIKVRWNGWSNCSAKRWAVKRKFVARISKKSSHRKMWEPALVRPTANKCKLISCSMFFFSQPFFTNRVFQIFDKDNSGSISLQEFIDAIHQFAGQSPEDKIKFLFKVYDIDGKYCNTRAQRALCGKFATIYLLLIFNRENVYGSSRVSSYLSSQCRKLMFHSLRCYTYIFIWRWRIDSAPRTAACHACLHGGKWNAVFRRAGKSKIHNIRYDTLITANGWY